MALNITYKSIQWPEFVYGNDKLAIGTSGRTRFICVMFTSLARPPRRTIVPNYSTTKVVQALNFVHN